MTTPTESQPVAPLGKTGWFTDVWVYPVWSVARTLI
jgi:hypothetical protein